MGTRFNYPKVMRALAARIRKAAFERAKVENNAQIPTFREALTLVRHMWAGRRRVYRTRSDSGSYYGTGGSSLRQHRPGRGGGSSDVIGTTGTHRERANAKRAAQAVIARAHMVKPTRKAIRKSGQRTAYRANYDGLLSPGANAYNNAMRRRIATA